VPNRLGVLSSSPCNLIPSVFSVDSSPQRREQAREHGRRTTFVRCHLACERMSMNNSRRRYFGAEPTYHGYKSRPWALPWSSHRARARRTERRTDAGNASWRCTAPACRRTSALASVATTPRPLPRKPSSSPELGAARSPYARPESSTTGAPSRSPLPSGAEATAVARALPLLPSAVLCCFLPSALPPCLTLSL
jgi:hypothetical protein